MTMHKGRLCFPHPSCIHQREKIMPSVDPPARKQHSKTSRHILPSFIGRPGGSKHRAYPWCQEVRPPLHHPPSCHSNSPASAPIESDNPGISHILRNRALHPALAEEPMQRVQQGCPAESEVRGFAVISRSPSKGQAFSGLSELSIVGTATSSPMTRRPSIFSRPKMSQCDSVIEP